MNTIIFACILGLALARPQSDNENTITKAREFSFAKIIKDDRVGPKDGSYSFDFETENGIIRSESGSPLDIEGNPTGQQGSFSYPLPNGEIFTLKFVANENGYQPESPFLPVAPAFPHPIPQYVLDQIAFAAQQDAEKASSK